MKSNGVNLILPLRARIYDYAIFICLNRIEKQPKDDATIEEFERNCLLTQPASFSEEQRISIAEICVEQFWNKNEIPFIYDQPAN